MNVFAIDVITRLRRCYKSIYSTQAQLGYENQQDTLEDTSHLKGLHLRVRRGMPVFTFPFRFTFLFLIICASPLDFHTYNSPHWNSECSTERNRAVLVSGLLDYW